MTDLKEELTKMLIESYDKGVADTKKVAEEAIIKAVEFAIKQEREACAKVCEQQTTYSMPIPCPDGIDGCCVAHFVPGSRAKTSQECAEEIRTRGEK